MRRSAPRQTLVLVITALATVLATCVAVAHGDSERDQRHERQLAIAENDLVHATVGSLDRLTDVASTVQGPLSVRRAQFDALASRLLDQKGSPRSRWPAAPGRAPVRSGADDASGAPPALQDRLLELARQGQPDPRRHAAVGRAAPRCRARSAAATRARPAVLPAVDGSPRSIAVAVPVRAAASGASGAFLATFSVPGVRDAVAPTCRRHADRARPGRRPVSGLENPLEKRVRLGDRDWTVAVGQPEARQGLALATLLVGGLLTILIGVVGSQARRRERTRSASSPCAAPSATAPSWPGSRRRRARACWPRPPPTSICVFGRTAPSATRRPPAATCSGSSPRRCSGARSPTSSTPTTPPAWPRCSAAARRRRCSITHRMRRRAARRGWRRGCASSATRDRRARRDPRDRPRRRRAHALPGRAGRGRGALPLRLRGGADRDGARRRSTSASCSVNRALCEITGYTRAAARGPPSPRSRTPTTSRPTAGARATARGRASPATAPSGATCTLGRASWVGGELDARARRRAAAALPRPDPGHHRAQALRGRAAATWPTTTR